LVDGRANLFGDNSLDQWTKPRQARYSSLLKTNIEAMAMASTSLSLGEHWETFLKREVASGRYGSVSEVIRDALRHLEERNERLSALRAHLAEGEAQALNGEFVEDYSIENLLAESDRSN
jgi:antitoxin ParD1/3/4